MTIQRDWVGRVVDGRFTLLQWLGGSDHSDVFLTELPGVSAQKAAIKLIPDRAGLEARIAIATIASRSHPNLVRVSQSGRCEIDGAPFVYVVTDYADEVLSEILPVRPLTPDEVKEMLVPVLDGLADLHRNGLVHGSLKPSNILVVKDRLKLSADSVQRAGQPVQDNVAESIYGTPEGVTPKVSTAADMWSLGVIIVEALTQKTPDWTPAANPGANIDPHIPDTIPQPFSRIAAACLRVNPADRATVNDVRAALGMTVPVSAPPAMPETISTAEPVPTGRPWMLVRVVVALVLIGMVALILWHSRTLQPAPQSSDSSSAQPVARTTPEPEPQPLAAAAPPPPSAVVQSHDTSGPVKGAVAQRVMPEVPPSASQSIRGTVNVRVRLNVSPGGEVTNAEFESAGPSKYFARIASDAARQWKFRPAQANGQPVASVWMLQFSFTSGTTDVIPEQTAP